MRLSALFLSCFSMVSALIVTVRADFQGSTHVMPFDEDTINYSKTPATGPIPRLQEAVDCGKTKLTFDPKYGYLPAVLKALNVSTTSQMLVFSKTSFQRERISPSTPRALFFTDDVYIGWIPGAPLLEVSQVDPKLGAVFYTLDQTDVERPKFQRNDQCLECHASGKSMGVPGHLLRSFATDDSGVVDLMDGIGEVNHRTPIAERWAGWYVTGKHGDQVHRGNLVGKAAFAKQSKTPNFSGNRTNLSELVNLERYPSGNSDIVALMVLEHQTHMHNFITRLDYEATISLSQYGHLNYLKSKIDAFVRYMLFVEETPITNQISGTSGFSEWFPRQGPRDSQKRSLREFDLKQRMFKYPCSYLVYSEAFNAMPVALKEEIYMRIWAALDDKADGPNSPRVPAEIKRATREILLETKEDFAKTLKARHLAANP